MRPPGRGRRGGGGASRLDGLVATAGLALAVAASSQPSCPPNSLVCMDRLNEQTAALGWVTALAYGTSTLVGAANVSACRDARARRDRCLSGLEEACRQPRSDWKPPAP